MKYYEKIPSEINGFSIIYECGDNGNTIKQNKIMPVDAIMTDKTK